MNQEQAVCRGCGRALRGKPYRFGGDAFIPETGERARINHYGGYVCSRDCDVRSSLEQLRSMPGCSTAREPDRFARETIRANWEKRT